MQFVLQDAKKWMLILPVMAVEVDDNNLFTEFTSDTEESEESDTDSDVDEEDAVIDNRGVKSECTLNCLQSFHCVRGFPLDLMHDLFEGG